MAKPPTDGPYPGVSGRTPQFQQARNDFLVDKAKGDDAGAYRRNAEREINRFIDWYKTRHGEHPTFDALDDTTIRQYARDALVTQDYTDGTVLTYYAHLSAFLGWCEREGYLEEHVAQTDAATEPLPDDDGRRSGDQQAWGPDERRRIIEHVNAEARSALEALEDGDGRWAAIKASRDRALVAVLCYTGIRAGELLARNDDPRRNGVTWGDIDLEDGRVTVLSKKQEWDHRSLPDQTLHALSMLRNILEPGDDWPVFCSLSPSVVFPPLREALQQADTDPEEIDAIVSKDRAFDLYRRHDLTPTPLQTAGARRIMRRLTEAAEIELDQGDYLEPHGGRRGAGEVLVRTHGYAAAARLLDNSEQMVRERYSHIEAGDLADVASSAFDAVDASSADPGPESPSSTQSTPPTTGDPDESTEIPDAYQQR